MISFDNISLMRGRQTLLRDVSLMLPKGRRTGVIGRNGCGKTSLFLVISGEIPLERGEIRMPAGLRCSTMSQETPGSSRTALDFVIDSHKEYRRLEAALAAAENAGDDHSLAALHGELEVIHGYDIKHRGEQLLSGLGFSTGHFDLPVSNFSGGWRVRLNLAAALMCPSDLLMLDEPTNHLDLEATVWLEQWLQKYQGTLLLISHDRTFLDGVIDHVINFENKSLDSYTGNYSAFEKQRAEKLALQRVLYEKQQRRRDQIENFVRRFRVKASKAKQAQSRLKELARMQDIAPAHVDSPFRFEFPGLDHLPAFLMQVEALAIGFDQPLVTDINLGIRSDSRIGLLGFNGSGKSTLLKVLAGQLDPLQGSVVRAGKLRIGYFAQHQVDALDHTLTPVELLRAAPAGKAATAATDQALRDFLGGFDFRGQRVDETIRHFSGGEKARLALARLVWQKPEFLLMDEPTNHLDLEMCHALTMALQDFGGAMIVVSHDRHLLANTVDEFYFFHEGVFSEFKGSLADFEKWLLRNAAAQARIEADSSTGVQKPDKKLRRRLAASRREQLAPLRKQERRLESEMEKLQAELQDIENRLGDEAIYTEKNKTELTATLQQQGRLKSTLQDKEDQWFRIQQTLAAL